MEPLSLSQEIQTQTTTRALAVGEPKSKNTKPVVVKKEENEEE
jgi:hypothetical protein